MRNSDYDAVMANVVNYRARRQHKLQNSSANERMQFLVNEQKRATKIARKLAEMEGDDNA